MGRVLIACEFSGIVRDAFAARGHDAWSCDLLPTEKPGNHYQDDVLQIVNESFAWDLIIGHPPCTRLANSGVRWLHERNLWNELEEACEFFNELNNAPVLRICLENPIPHKYARGRIGDYDQLIQPWQFGHGETKATCLWLKNLPPLIPEKIVEGRYPRCHREPPGKDRQKNRQRTYQGIANAMAEQWGCLIS